MPLFEAISWHRVAHRLYKMHIPLVPRFIDALIFLFFNSAIHHTTEIGKGTHCAYRGMSVLIHKRTRIGNDVYVGAHVVIGGRSGLEDVPTIEDGVFLGPNSIILGPITVGKGTIVGAGAVVLASCDPQSVLVGNPARRIPRKEQQPP